MQHRRRVAKEGLASGGFGQSSGSENIIGRKNSNQSTAWCVHSGCSGAIRSSQNSHHVNRTAARISSLATEEVMVDSRRARLRIYTRNKHLRRLRHFPPGPILVFVHGATYPASSSVDLELGGSPGWISARSAGYGRSTRPVAMDSPPMPRSRRREPLIQRLCRRHRLGVSPSRIMRLARRGAHDCRGIRGRPAGESQPPRALHANLAAAIDDDPNLGRDRRSARIGR